LQRLVNPRGKIRLTSRRLQLIHLLRDACIAASPSWTVIAVFKRSKDCVWHPRPVQKHAQGDRYQNVRRWTWSLELAWSYSDIIPSTYLDAQSVLVTGIWSAKTFILVPPGKTFLYSSGLTAEVEPLSTPHLPSPSTCGGHLGASDPSSHQWCTMQCAGMLWGISVLAAPQASRSALHTN
jgi:hypothetical protein